MYKFVSLVFKGIIIGLAKVIPGVSGSLIALSLGLYEKGIDAISNFLSDIKNNIYFLGAVGSGILLAIIFGSKIINYFLVTNYFYTMFLFTGLLIGTIPNLVKRVNPKKKKDYLLIITVILIMCIINFISSNNLYKFNNTTFDYIYTILMGFIDAATMIIPGISGTAIFILMGVYQFILSLFSNILSNINILVFFAIGLVTGILLITKLMNYLFDYHSNIIYPIILGFSISSVIILFIKTVSKINFNYQILFYFIFIIIGYKVGKKFDS